METVAPEYVAIYILCGGASSRMGRCKTTVEVEGQTMLSKIVETVRTTQKPLFLIGKIAQHQQLQQYDTPCVIDQHDFYHPLNGVVTGLTHAQSNGFQNGLFLPCDTPFITTKDIRMLLKECPSVAQDPNKEIHPLILHIPTTWSMRAQSFLYEQRSMKSFAEPAGLVTLSHNSLRNLNRPSDLPNTMP